MVLHVDSSMVISAHPAPQAEPRSTLRYHCSVAASILTGVLSRSAHSRSISKTAARCSSMFLSNSPLVHASAGVPPHDVLINPIGTPNSRYNSRPKKYATAEKLL